ncbi:hypothetical protein Taro_002983 [Colocasia esculenta]|uniref:BZIP domain-containing protein n=1 Tax=Colocasia esculenta TaxID=4460 RepID=A0A843TI50_COLES|nr:hypothetical protein [Colocasia esculenta]
MWQAVQDPHHSCGSNNSGQNPHMVVSSSSKSSSSSSSPSRFTSTTVPQTPGRTMEEVWKDITIGSATPILDNGGHRSPYQHHHPAAAATCHSSIANADLSHLRGMIFQDFLARPFTGKAAVPAASVQPAEERGHHGDTRLPGPRAPRRSSPAIVLSLKSGADFRYMDAAPPGPPPPAGFPNSRNQSHGQHHGTNSQQQPSPSSSLTGVPLSVSLGSPCPGIFPFCTNKKRAPELHQHQHQHQLESSDGAGGDRRNKRMIKNRESAARSRARKQAYTNELELEVNHLTEENERLRRQHEEVNQFS